MTSAGSCKDCTGVQGRARGPRQGPQGDRDLKAGWRKDRKAGPRTARASKDVPRRASKDCQRKGFSKVLQGRQENKGKTTAGFFYPGLHRPARWTRQGVQGLQGDNSRTARRDQGLQGVQGPQGDQGPQGVQGLHEKGAEMRLSNRSRAQERSHVGQGVQGPPGRSMPRWRIRSLVPAGVDAHRGVARRGLTALAGETQGPQGVQGPSVGWRRMAATTGPAGGWRGQRVPTGPSGPAGPTGADGVSAYSVVELTVLDTKVEDNLVYGPFAESTMVVALGITLTGEETGLCRDGHREREGVPFLRRERSVFGPCPVGAKPLGGGGRHAVTAAGANTVKYLRLSASYASSGSERRCSSCYRRRMARAMACSQSLCEGITGLESTPSLASHCAPGHRGAYAR